MTVTASTSSPVRSEVSGKIMTLTLNRPEKKNALTLKIYLTLVEALGTAAATPEIQVVVLTGEGDCFCAGNDLDDFINAGDSDAPRPGRLFLDTISTFPKPILAAVNGKAVGIGTTLLLHCDLVYAATEASFSLPFVRLGLCPEGASSFLLPATVGHQRAAEMLLLGETISAPQAKAFGLINDVFPADRLKEEVLTRAARVADHPQAALLLTKRLLRASREMAIAEAIETESRHFTDRLASRAFKAAYDAFMRGRRRADPEQT